MKLSSSQILLGIYLSLRYVLASSYSGNLPQLQLPINNGKEILWSTYRPANSPPHLQWAWIEGVIVRNRTRAISGQAIGGVLIQSIYNMVFEESSARIPYFEWILVYPPHGSRFPLNVTFRVESRNRPQPYELTARRLSTALSNMGNCFDSQWDLGQMYEWDFEIGVLESLVYPTNRSLEVIANGSITHVAAAVEEI
ncbi:MAG: hypothetical protein Q9213_005082 [Squamulea squamosa]